MTPVPSITAPITRHSGRSCVPAGTSRPARGRRHRPGSRGTGRRRARTPRPASAGGSRRRPAGCRCRPRWPRRCAPGRPAARRDTSIMAVAPRCGRRRAGRSTAPPAAGTPRRAPSASGSRGTARCSRPPRARSGRPAPPRRPGCAPERRTGGRPARSPSAVTAMVSVGLADMSPPTTAAPTGSASAASPSASSSAQRRIEVGRHAERDQQRGRRRAHRGDVGQVGRGRPVPDVRRRRPVPPEVPALDQHVGGGHDPAVGRGDHGGVVTRAEQAWSEPVPSRDVTRRSARTRRWLRESYVPPQRTASPFASLTPHVHDHRAAPYGDLSQLPAIGALSRKERSWSRHTS